MEPAHDTQSTNETPDRRRRWPLLLLLLLAAGGSGIWATTTGGPNPPPIVTFSGPTAGHPAHGAVESAAGASPAAQPAGARSAPATRLAACPTTPPVDTPPPTTVPAPSTSPPSGSVQQEISVAVRPGGPIRISPASVTTQATGSVVTVGPVDVVDPRGTLAGWRVYATVVTPGWLVATSSAVPVSGLASDLCQPVPTSTPKGVLVAAAPAGGGGGTFAVAVSLTGGAPGSVEVRFSVVGTGP